MNVNASGYIYIASPYSDPEPLIREERFLRVSYYLKQCLTVSKWAYSPIVHCHDLAKTWDLPKDAEFWKNYNFSMLAGAREMEVLRLDGWERSLGIKDEIKQAEFLGLRVVYV